MFHNIFNKTGGWFSGLMRVLVGARGEMVDKKKKSQTENCHTERTHIILEHWDGGISSVLLHFFAISLNM